MKTRLLLVNPSKGFNAGCIPLGLASIAAYVKQHVPEVEIALLDANCQDIYADYIPSDIVAITATTQDISEAITFAEYTTTFIRKPLRILGGPHISTYRILPPSFSIGVIGEGEETMVELVRLDGSKKFSDIKGICYNECGKTIVTEPRPLIADLDTLPIPDRDIANMDYYLKPRNLIPYYTGRTLTMITSRGCPFNCVFCSSKVHWQKFRAFSAERVVAEIELLVSKYHAEIIHIFDDLFIADRNRLKLIHDLLIMKGLHKRVKFMCLARSDMLDDKTMRMLKEMNVAVIGIGMESGNPRTLHYLKKNTTTVERNRDAIELASRYGIVVMGSFMIGNPYETEEELMGTLEFIREYRTAPYFSPLVYIAAAFPGTAFWEYGKDNGVDVENFRNIVMDIPKDITTLSNAPLLTKIPLQRFFEISQMFAREQSFGGIKKYIFAPGSPLDAFKAFGMGAIIADNPAYGMIDVGRMVSEYVKCKTMPLPFVPVDGALNYNIILTDEMRELYHPVEQQMWKYVPGMMQRKLKRATVQQAFTLNTVHSFMTSTDSPKVLCVGSFEDTTAASLKVLGYDIEEIDPTVNCDLDEFCRRPRTKLGSYSVVFSTSVIEHVDDDEQFVRQIASLLRPGGVMVLTCDFNDAYVPGMKKPTVDKRLYTRADLVRLVTAAGNCSLIDPPLWGLSEPDFEYEGSTYSFATLVMGKWI
jgi:radical SAM superfamily enzyme YgiQ (UPF0313 family)